MRRARLGAPRSLRPLPAAAFGLALFGGLLSAAAFAIPAARPATYLAASPDSAPAASAPAFAVTHLPTPKSVKGVYMSQCVVGTPAIREGLVSLIEETELNAVIIDIKDYTGRIAFPTDHPLLRDSASSACGARDMREFIGELHEKGIYVIGRITVFQDPSYTKLRPDLAVQKASDRSVWKDYKGLSFIDVGAEEFWRYIVALGKESHAIGFDELNFDYIRYPSDGPMRDIFFPLSEARLLADPAGGKASVLKDFFAFLERELRPTGAILSADLFGMTTTNTDDLNIGQILEDAAAHFDYIAPMVYPSHYPPGFNGWKNPNEHPYDIVFFSLSRGAERLAAASSTPEKLRPWLQDFDYGGDYDVAEVKAQIQATYDAGLQSWMLWSPSNRYTRGALAP